MFNIHAVVSEFDKGNQTQLVDANINDPPPVFILKFGYRWKHLLKLVRVCEITSKQHLKAVLSMAAESLGYILEASLNGFREIMCNCLFYLEFPVC